ncbi:DUF5362 family protein [uncultured Flavobacterium sp.]|uniref:DUF5362 family protein n=1 Tax=uncultured Flavobacterium sp. TaxID=165435 RepID=UPI0025F697B3|nr:DUF5362 family protein [uncultured Flavobacterium sp.]
MDDYKGSYNDQSSSFDSFELQLTSLAKEYLTETAKWAKFLSIMGFIFLGFMLLGALSMFALGSSIDNFGGGGFGTAFGAFAGVLYLLVALLYFFPVLYLYKFATKARTALYGNNSQELTAALENLKSHYKFVGILTIVILAFYVLMIFIGILGAAMM